MRIAYITHTRFPTEKAHGIQIAHVCNALAKLGHQVTLFRPTVWNAVTADPFAFYGIDPSFTVEPVSHFDAQRSPFIPGSLGFTVNMWFYRNALRRSERLSQFDLLYVRSPVLLPTLLNTNIPVVLELHSLPTYGRKTFVDACNRCRLVVCLTRAMQLELVSWGVDPSRTVVEPDGVDLEQFLRAPYSEDAKKSLSIPAGHPVIGYAGSLVARNTLSKGVEVLVEALGLLKKNGRKVFGLIVGGPNEGVLKKHAHHVGLDDHDIFFTGRLPSHQVPTALRACTVCVYPAPRSSDPFFVRDTSPLKLFEYLASDIPTVCADIPPVRDIVDESCVTFFTPGDAESLTRALLHVLDHPKESEEKAKKGRTRAERHDWKERMRRIVSRAH